MSPTEPRCPYCDTGSCPGCVPNLDAFVGYHPPGSCDACQPLGGPV